MKPFRIFLPLTIILFVVSLTFGEDRTWTDRGGKFQIEAMFLDFDGKDVKLKKKEDGKVISLPLDKLSLPDQVYVKKMMKELGGGEEPKPQAEEEQPKSTKTPSKKKAPEPQEDDEEDASDQPSADRFTGKIPVTRYSTARQIRTDLAKSFWAIPPDPATVAKLGFNPDILDFPFGKQEFSTRTEVRGVAFCDRKPEKILTAVSLTYRSDEQATKVFFGDMKTGLILSQTWPVKLEPLALSPDGTKALFVQGKPGRSSFDKGVHLTISDTTNRKLPCIGVLIPFAEDRQDSSRDSNIAWAEWIDDENILVQAEGGRLLLLNDKTGAPIWTLEGNRAEGSTLSQGKKYVIAKAKDGAYCLLETKTGKPIGVLRTPPGVSLRSSAAFAFSPNGTRIAAVADGWVHLWDATTGAFKDSFYANASQGFRPQLHWIGEKYLIFNGLLIEVEQQLPIWKYTGVQDNDVVFGGLYWCVPRSIHNEVSFPIWGISIPHDSMPKLPKLSDAQKYCVRPGITICLYVDPGIPDNAAVRAYVMKMLDANGIKVAERAPITLSLLLRSEAPQEVSYRSMGLGFGSEKATFTPRIYSYEFEMDGKTLWKTVSRPIPPPIVTDRGNRSLQEYVTDYTTPKSAWYLNVALPAKIPFDKAGTSPIIPRRK